MDTMGPRDQALRLVGEALAQESAFLCRLMLAGIEEGGTIPFRAAHAVLAEKLDERAAEFPADQLADARCCEDEYLLAYCFSRFHEMRRESGLSEEEFLLAASSVDGYDQGREMQ